MHEMLATILTFDHSPTINVSARVIDLIIGEDKNVTIKMGDNGLVIDVNSEYLIDVSVRGNRITVK